MSIALASRDRFFMARGLHQGRRDRQSDVVARILGCNVIADRPDALTVKATGREIQWWRAFLAHDEISVAPSIDGWSTVTLTWPAVTTLLNGIGAGDPDLRLALDFCRGRSQ